MFDSLTCEPYSMILINIKGTRIYCLFSIGQKIKDMTKSVCWQIYTQKRRQVVKTLYKIYIKMNRIDFYYSGLYL